MWGGWALTLKKEETSIKTTSLTHHRSLNGLVNRRETRGHSCRSTGLIVKLEGQDYDYIVAVIDLFSRQCVNVLRMAFWRRKLEFGLRHHSDR